MPLAVDREVFGKRMSALLKNHPFIEYHDEIVSDPLASLKKYGCDVAIVCTGPLTLGPLEKWIATQMSEDDFYFYDAIAPIVDSDSLDYSKLYFRDRHGPVGMGGNQGDYLNVPLSREEYDKFVEAARRGRKSSPQKF